MLQFGYAQEIITPPVGVGLAGYFNLRPNKGMYDDLYVKVIMIESAGKRFGFIAFDLLGYSKALVAEMEKRITETYGRELYESLIICATHTHTGPEFRNLPDEKDERTVYAFNLAVNGALRALDRAIMNIQPGEIEIGSVYNNPYGFVRRYWMKDGTIVTNPGWRNPEIDRPESDYDRTIGIIALKQNGRLAALICNIANHGDTIGGDLVSADWYGRFTQEIQHQLKTSLPVMVLDDASGNINHFDFRQDIHQTSYDEAVRIGRGYAAIVLNQLDKLEKLNEEPVVIRNTIVEVPHRKISPEELAEAKHILATVPDIKKEGDFESQDLAKKVPAALRHFAQRTVDCHDKSVPSHTVRLTSFRIGNQVVFASLPGEPFNGIGAAIRAGNPCRYTFVAEMAQSFSAYVPMRECFERGGYEVQPGIDTVAPEAADILIEASLKNIL